MTVARVPSVIAPGTVEEVAAALARASRDNLRVAVEGGGTKRGWGPPAQPVDLTLSTLRLDRVLAHRHGDLTATVQAGAPLVDVNRELGRRGQWIPLDPPWADRATIGGIVATNDSGPRRHRYGAPRDLLIGIDIVRADGVAAKSGGIVVKNVAGYDLARLMSGSFGSLAVIVSATFKLFPLAAASRTVVVDFGGDTPAAPAFEHLGAVVQALLARQLTPTAVEVEAVPLRLLIRFESTDAAADRHAEEAVRLAGSEGAAAIAAGDEEAALWNTHDGRPWGSEGAIVKISVLPAEVPGTLAWLSRAHGGAVKDVVGRAGLGVLIARIEGDTPAQARILGDVRARLQSGGGSAVVVRGTDDLRSAVDVWGPPGDGFGVMQAVKHAFDPKGILNPGRGPGGL